MSTRRRRVAPVPADDAGSPAAPVPSTSSDGAFPSESARSRQLARAIKTIDGFRLFSQVERPLIVRTRITSLNRALHCGGYPCQMLGVLHGPSQGGKSLLLAEILHAAHATGGWALFVDAESRAVDLKWYACVLADLREVVYDRPPTFEACIKRVGEFRAKFRAAKDAGELSPGAVCAVGIDSINRLTPSTELEELLKGNVKERGYPIRALMTSRWLDKLVPTLGLDETVVFVQRESTRIDAAPGQRTWQVKGGRAVTYDGGWILRVEAVAAVKSEDGERVGEKHSITVMKNSMGPHLDDVATFYSSAGRDGAPLGLDFVREVREEAIARKVITYVSGTGYRYRGRRAAELGVERDAIVAASKRELPAWIRDRWAPLARELDDAAAE